MPQWDGWTLAEMSQNPRAVKTWHAKLSKTIPTTADHCARLIRACYREEARLDRMLNPAASPTSGIRLGKIKVSKAVLDFPDFSVWRKAWDKIENPVHKGYHLAGAVDRLSANRACHDPRERYRSRRAAHDHPKRESWKRYLAADHGRDCFRAGDGHQRASANHHDEGPSRNEVRRGPRDRTKETTSRDRGSRSCLSGRSSSWPSLGPSGLGQRAPAYVPQHRGLAGDFGDADFVPHGAQSARRLREVHKRVDDRELASSSRGAREDQSPDFRIARAHARRITMRRSCRTRRAGSKRAGKRAPLRPASLETGEGAGAW